MGIPSSRQEPDVITGVPAETYRRFPLFTVQKWQKHARGQDEGQRIAESHAA
jgi:hypothetical protein